MLLLLVGCFAHYPLVPTTTAPPAAETAAPPAADLPPITFSPLEERLEVVFSGSTDADQRDRLSNLRELLHAMRAKDPVAQRRVYDFADAQLKIEARALPQTLPVEEGLEPLTVPIEERPLGAPETGGATPTGSSVPATTGAPAAPSTAAASTAEMTAGAPTTGTPATDGSVPPPAATPTAADLLASAHAQFGAGAYLDAIATLAPLTSAEATTLRKEAVDAWARAEREAAGTDFLNARAMPAGPDRTAALVKARDRLVAVNSRFPDNNFAAVIAENIAKVNAELGP